MKQDLAFGLRAEKKILARFKPWLQDAPPGKKYDLETIDGFGVEVKADRYKSSKNIFLEKFYDVDKRKIGGPWRAEKDGAVYFVYWFTELDQTYVFRTKDLLVRLESLNLEPYRKRVPNARWMTEGYAVPRELIEDLSL